MLVSFVPFSATNFFRLAALNAAFAAASAVHQHAQPFRSPLLNRLEFASLSVGFATLAAALFFTDSTLSSGAAIALTAVLCALHGGFLVLLVAALARASKVCTACWVCCGDKLGDASSVNDADADEDAARRRRADLFAPLRDQSFSSP